MGSFNRRVERRAARRENKMLLVSVLNDPTRKMQVPVSYRDNLLKHYGLSIGDLVSEAAFHIVFVLEGVVFGFITKHGDQARCTLHVLELDSEENIRVVGREIYDYWQALPSALTFEVLRERYAEMAGALGWGDAN